MGSSRLFFKYFFLYFFVQGGLKLFCLIEWEQLVLRRLLSVGLQLQLRLLRPPELPHAPQTPLQDDWQRSQPCQELLGCRGQKIGDLGQKQLVVPDLEERVQAHVRRKVREEKYYCGRYCRYLNLLFFLQCEVLCPKEIRSLGQVKINIYFLNYFLSLRYDLFFSFSLPIALALETFTDAIIETWRPRPHLQTSLHLPPSRPTPRPQWHSKPSLSRAVSDSDPGRHQDPPSEDRAAPASGAAAGRVPPRTPTPSWTPAAIWHPLPKTRWIMKGSALQKGM